jgi:hypothetical protein
MLDFGSITTWEAIKEFGITRISARIFELRKRGYFIDNEWEYTTNRYGDKIKYVRYTLNKEKTFDFSMKPQEIGKSTLSNVLKEI